MRYYIVKDSTNEREIGSYPQLGFDVTKTTYGEEEFIEETKKFLSTSKDIIDASKMHGCLLNKGSLYTEIMKVNFLGLRNRFFSEYCIHRLNESQLNLVNLKMSSNSLKIANDEKFDAFTNYYFGAIQPLQLTDLRDLVDFKNTSLGSFMAMEENPEFSSYDDFISKRREDLKKWGSVYAKEIKLLDHIDADLFTLAPLLNDILCTDRFKEYYVEQNFSGLRFKEAPIVVG